MHNRTQTHTHITTRIYEFRCDARRTMNKHDGCFLTLNRIRPPFCSGHSVGSDPAPGGSGAGSGEDGAGSRVGARGPRQRAEPRDDDGSRRHREPHGGGPPAPGPRHPGGHAGGEGGAYAALCGEDRGADSPRAENSTAAKHRFIFIL